MVWPWILKFNEVDSPTFEILNMYVLPEAWQVKHFMCENFWLCIHQRKKNYWEKPHDAEFGEWPWSPLKVLWACPFMRTPSGEGRDLPESRNLCNVCKLNSLTQNQRGNKVSSKTGRKKYKTQYPRERWIPHLVVSLVPVTDEKSEISIRVRKRNRDPRSFVNIDRPKPPCCFVEWSGRKICEGTDLILSLEIISVIAIWWDGAIGSKYSILPRVLPLLDAIPNRRKNTRLSEPEH